MGIVSVIYFLLVCGVFFTNMASDNPDPPVLNNPDPPVVVPNNLGPPVLVPINPDPPVLVPNNPDLPVLNHQATPVINNEEMDNSVEQQIGNTSELDADNIPDGAGDTPYNVEDDIQPRDSISQVKSNVRSTASSSFSKIKYKEKRREIELQTELKNLVQKNRIADERRDLERRLQIEKAEEEVRQASERAMRLRRDQELQDRLSEIKRKEEELKIQSQLSVATELNRIYVDSEISFKPRQYKTTMVTEPKVTDDFNKRIPVNIESENSVKIQSENPVRVQSEPAVVNIQNNPAVNNHSDNNQITSILSKLIDQQREQALPSQELKTFSGENILDYPIFKTNFKYVVEDKTDDPARRLEFLLKYTKADAYELIKQCPMITPAAKAYKRARDLLERDYGDPYIQAATFKAEAESWPKILPGDNKGLKKFSLFINNGCNVKMSNSDMHSMDSSDFLNLLAAKLPVAYQQRWIGRLGDLRDSGKSPKLDDLETFVSKISRNVNDPRVIGLGYQLRSTTTTTTNNKIVNNQRHHGNNNSNYGNKQNYQQRKVFSTQVKENSNLAAKAPCLNCTGMHSLLDCRKFGSLSLTDKSETVKRKGLCFGCLNPGHMKANCTNRDWAKCDKCPRSHTTVMHDHTRDERAGTSIDSKSNDSKPNLDKNKISSGCVMGNSNPLMAIVPVLVKHNSSDDCVATYAFVDNGSGACFTNTDLVRRLRLNGRHTSVTLKTLNSEETFNTEILNNLQVGNLNGDNFLELPPIYVNNDMPVDNSDIPKACDINKFKHLRHISLPDISGHSNAINKVSLMIGVNMPAATTPLEICIGRIGEPYAIKSPLGWLFYGLPGKLKSSAAISVNFCKIDQDLEVQVKKYFDLEFSERLSDDKLSLSVNDRQFVKTMTDSIKLEDNHYVTNLPFKDRTVVMPNNKLQAETFALKLRNRLLKNPSLCEHYTKFMDNLESKHYSERVPQAELDRRDGRVWFVPHHSVVHPKKPDKVRVVFNCPLMFNGTSLNNELLQGPDFTNLLLGVLLRWRQERFAVMADIEQMFYQVRVDKADVDTLRFLWWPNGQLNSPVKEYRMLVHLFGAVSSPSCANFALRQTAIDNTDNYSSETINAINKDFYVDDFLKSLPTESECITVITEICDLLSKGGFKLTKWVSNSRNVLSAVPEKDLADKYKDLDIFTEALPMQRALGVQWNVESDNIEFIQSEVNPCATRRNILSVLSSIYDPLGISSPFVLKCKILLQNLCRDKISWDEPISSHYEKDWKEWLSDLGNLDNLFINRCVKPINFGNIIDTQIHHFGDASQEGYGSVSYLRYESDSGDVYISFVLGRSRVAPIKPHTIVRLELAAATSIVRINNMLNREMTLPINQVYYWSDSQTILKYIHNVNSRYQVFVANRLAIIHDGSSVDQWRFVPGKLNPADIASRGSYVENINNSFWISGPEFLKLPINEWPENIVPPTTESVPISVTKVDSVNAVNIIIEKYSDWCRLKRAISWWIRFKEILKCKSKSVPLSPELLKKTLSVKEIDNAECEIIKFVQKSSFPNEIKSLCDDTGVKVKSDLCSLDPFLKDGILRVGGRLKNANIPFNAKHQILLPKNHYVSLLIVRYYHHKVGHQGRNYTLAELRSKFWIIKAGVLIKTILSKCVICKTIQASVCEQKMADLPPSRVLSCEPAFTHVGMDYFGPFEIKVGRSLKKRYGVVFTCFSSRAIHLEVSESLDTSSCVNSIRRFVARRGNPSDIYSDNGTNLVGANSELKNALRELNIVKINNYAVLHGIKWHFNPPTASHFGGVWERQIRTVRKILQSILREQFLRTAQGEEELRTIFCEIEAIVNSRPLTKVSNDSNDLEVITPNSLLLCRQNDISPPGIFNDRDVYAKKRWRQIQYITDLFWKRWTREYLPELQKREKWIKPSRNVQIGDVALIIDSSAPRGSWPMGVVVEVYPDKNGLVRSVKLKTKTSVFVRPVAKLVLILEADN